MECDISEIEVIDDDDHFFSELDLDNIIAQEQIEQNAIAEEEIKENRVFSSPTTSSRNGKAPPKKIPRLQYSDSSSERLSSVKASSGKMNPEFVDLKAQVAEKPTDQKGRCIPFLKKKGPPKPLFMSTSTPSSQDSTKKFRFQKSKSKTLDPLPVPEIIKQCEVSEPGASFEDNFNEAFVDFDDDDDLMLCKVDENDIIAAQERQNAAVPVPSASKNVISSSASNVTSSGSSKTTSASSSATLSKFDSSKKFTFQKSKSSSQSQKSVKLPAKGALPVTNFFTTKGKEEPKLQLQPTNADSNATTFDSSTTSFEVKDDDDDDHFFSKIDLDKIIAQEQNAIAEEEVKKNRVFSSTTTSSRNGKAPPKKIPRLQYSDPSSERRSPVKSSSEKVNPEVVDLDDDDDTQDFFDSSFTIPSPVIKQSQSHLKEEVSEKPTDQKGRCIPFVMKKNPPKPLSMSTLVPSSQAPTKKFSFRKSKSKTLDPLPVPEIIKQCAVPSASKNGTLSYASNVTSSGSSKTPSASSSVPSSKVNSLQKLTFQKSKSSSQPQKPVKSLAEGELPITNFFSTKGKEEPKLQLQPTNTDSSATTFDSSTTSFELEDDDDDILAAIDLENITTIQPSYVIEKKPESRRISQEKKNPFLKPATPPPPPQTSSSTIGKRFSFQKHRTSLGQTQQSKEPILALGSSTSDLQPSRPIAPKSRPAEEVQINSNCNNFGSPDFLEDHELEEIMKLERTAQEDTSSKHLQPTMRPPKTLPYIFPPCLGSVAADEEWRKYLETFAKETSFRTPWFQSIPITGLNISSCRTIVSRLENPDQLVDFGLKYVLPFLKELKAATAPQKGKAETAILDREYYTEMALALEKVLVRYKEEYFEDEVCNSMPSISAFDELVEAVFNLYFRSEVDFSMTSIPEILLRLYPSALDKIVRSVVNTGNVALVLPLCSSSQTLQRILEMLHFNVQNASINDSDDPDFECSIKRTSMISITRKLLESLKVKLGIVNFVNILPRGFQSLYAIELALKSKSSSSSLIRNEVIVQQILPYLDEVFHEGNEEFAQFLINMIFPLTQTLLQDRQLTRRTVKYMLYPNLWHYLRQTLWQTD